MAGSSEPAFSFEYKKGAIAPWMITHLFCNSPFFVMNGFFAFVHDSLKSLLHVNFVKITKNLLSRQFV